MPQFMDFHEDLKLPPEAIAQIAEDTRNATASSLRSLTAAARTPAPRLAPGGACPLPRSS